jgi:hypothetical protein
MTGFAQGEHSLTSLLEERATVLARQTGCLKRQRKCSGADLVHMVVFGWLTQPDASLEMVASLAATRAVQIPDTAVHKRFTKACARTVHTL